MQYTVSTHWNKSWTFLLSVYGQTCAEKSLSESFENFINFLHIQNFKWAKIPNQNTSRLFSIISGHFSIVFLLHLLFIVFYCFYCFYHCFLLFWSDFSIMVLHCLQSLFYFCYCLWSLVLCPICIHIYIYIFIYILKWNNILYQNIT